MDHHELEEKQDIKRLVLEYNDREEELNGLGAQTTNWMHTGGNKAFGRGHTWEGTGLRGSGTRNQHYRYSGGVHYSRKRQR